MTNLTLDQFDQFVQSNYGDDSLEITWTTKANGSRVLILTPFSGDALIMETLVMKIEIKDRWSGEIKFTVDGDSIKVAIQELVKQRANLQRADLQGADLYGANLQGANLQRAENSDWALSMTVITPEGQLVGWKQCKNGVIVKLTIPAEAKRSNATGRKCRAEYADVVEVIGAEVGISQHDGTTQYKVGERVTCHNWDDNRFNECSGGIHFFLTRIEAEKYN